MTSTSSKCPHVQGVSSLRSVIIDIEYPFGIGPDITPGHSQFLPVRVDWFRVINVRAIVDDARRTGTCGQPRLISSRYVTSAHLASRPLGAHGNNRTGGPHAALADADHAAGHHVFPVRATTGICWLERAKNRELAQPVPLIIKRRDRGRSGRFFECTRSAARGACPSGSRPVAACGRTLRPGARSQWGRP
jgi:hypothetical protein